MLFLRIAWRNVWRQRRRSLLTLGAIALGVAFTVLFRGIGDGFHEQMVDNSVRAHIGHLEVHRTGYHDNPTLAKTLTGVKSLEDDIRGLPGLRGYSIRVLGDGLISNAENSAGVAIVGVEPEMESTVTSIHNALVAGTYLAGGDRPALLGDRLARKLGVGLGDKVVVMAQAADGALGANLFRVSGVFRSGAADLDRATLYVLRRDAQDLFALGERVTEAAILLHSSRDVDGTQKELVSRIGGADLEVLAWHQVEPFLKQFIELDDAFIVIIAAILFIVVSIGILNTIMMSVFERVREFGVMMALGTKPAQIVRLVVVEALLLAVVGILLGAAAGGAATVWFGVNGIDLSAWDEGMSIAGITTSVINPVLTAANLIWSGATVLVLVVVVAIYPAARAARLNPIDAIRHT
jgi:ABC-type lipoprotein release transport system permease subunit